MESALLITVVGMGAVYAFLILLTCVVRFVSFCVRDGKKDNEQMEKIAAVIGIALQGEKR